MRKFLIVLLSIVAITSFAFMLGCDKKPNDGDLPPQETPPAVYQFKSSELDKYVIVYNNTNPDYFTLANKLRTRINTKYRVNILTKIDTSFEPTEYEILLGDTNRDDVYSKVMEYSVTVNNGVFRINVGGSISADAAVKYLYEKVFVGKEIVLDNGEYYQKSLLNTSSEITSNSTARVMSANLLADVFANGSYNKAYYRAEIFAGMLVAYKPDVLGLQETDQNWYNAIDDYLIRIKNAYGITYKRHFALYENKVNYTSLLYRSDKFKVEDSGVKVFTWWTDGNFLSNYHMRNISWAQFTSLTDDSEKFVLANTHWSYRTEHDNGYTYLSGSSTPIKTDELRTQCKDETKTYMATLKQKYPTIPIFLVGDFNTSLPYFTQYNWLPSGFKIISEQAKENGTSLSTVPTSGHFDHIFGTGNYTVRKYQFFNGATNQHSTLTDHPFVYADLKF
jgi:endonuclease/exonuclease/phosphatase family metal-dependent hydrolase